MTRESGTAYAAVGEGMRDSSRTGTSSGAFEERGMEVAVEFAGTVEFLLSGSGEVAIFDGS